ncbi:hypothetical protein LCGC14_1009600 [marine sediment metagenome]|uniref:Terminase small subunit n=1 Tax=marine sediment metagenome TaxID=412755 RepID=A0A0F9NLZ8_9ZZZZ|nr:terminase small subunit [Pricia sp.]
MIAEQPLTAKQERFIEEYMIDLNATQAAIKAGYSINSAKVIGCQNLTKLNVGAEIARRMAIYKEKHIADRAERQDFWTKMMNDSKASNADKLRASELLGKSEADFTDNIHQSGQGLEINITERPKRKVIDSKEIEDEAM